MSNYYKRPGLFGGFSLFPPVIKILLVSNTAIFVIFNLLLSGFQIGGISVDLLITKYFALNPLTPVLFKNSFGQITELSFYPWQIFTYMFLHGGFFHLLLNMFALWMFGVELENMWGQKRFLYYYFLCGVGAGLCNLLIAPMFTSVGPTVGASGAVYGILVAFGYLFPNRSIYIYGILPVKAKFLVIFYMLLEIFAVAGGQESNIAHIAHLGGGLVGLIYMLVVFKRSNSFFNTSSFKDKFKTPSPEKKTYSPSVFSSGGKVSKENVSEAKYEELDQTDFKKELEDQHKQAQEKIDRILDKLSEGGYQSLTEEEKKVLFHESKKLR
ncbi:MAG TPA: rhomboid family intramembrane serine protease [Ignavibacteria bacterium]|nr:rhomboid family intramembrane serine protease [Bacteroidota bacterium]HRI85225.1 rhomboid family intramembrane serine protease [Ignavibacteria bacterium]HRK00335.1 rhomboid family intramembrane serine protease [Ignavibacteria bacterium]